MGRWRRRGGGFAPGGNNGGGESGNGRRRRRGKGNNHPPFAQHELDRIRSYLHQYRVRAEQVCFQHKHVHDDLGAVGDDGSREDMYVDTIVIARHTFPALAEDILSAPYIDLPSTLSAKQRRVVHELCVDVGLFHCGAGNRNVPNDRRIVVSIHYDGLQHVPNLNEPIGVPVMRWLPWYYRNDHVNVRSDTRSNGTDQDKAKCLADANNQFVLNSTLKGRQAIEALIDQPGRCLRDAHDAINFSELEGMDLSQDDVLPNIDGKQDAWMLVDTPEKMSVCVREITDSQATEIGFDLECYNRSRYVQATCLIQLHANDKDYVVDTLAPGVWDAVPLLEPLFSDPNLVKIGHSVTGTDVPSLHRDFGLFLVNSFDTYEAAKVLNLQKKNLAGLCEHYGLRASEEYSTLKKEYQSCDWRRRPLTEPMIRYGRYDAHFLVKLRKLMIRDLTRGELWDKSTSEVEEEAKIVAAALAATLRLADGSEAADNGPSVEEFSRQSSTLTDDGGYFTPGEEELDESIEGTGDEQSSRKAKKRKRRSVFSANELRLHLGHMRVISLSQEACLKLWKAPREQVFKNDAFVDALKQASHGTLNWNDGHTELYQNLVQWRNRVADVEGTYPEAICSLDLLVSICKRMPSCHWSLRQIDYFLPAILADESLGYSGELFSIVESSGSYCTSSGGEKKESTRLVVRSYEERISVGGDGIGGEGAIGNISSTSEENDEPQSTSPPSSANRSLKQAAAFILASAALGTVAIIAMRTMKMSKR